MLRFKLRRSTLSLMLTGAVLLTGSQIVNAQYVIPGTGQRVENSGDDFEDEEWTFNANLPKSSYNIDKQHRQPFGGSENGRWSESPLRGQPDIIKRVATPTGGLPGSKGSMMMRSLYVGTPGSTGKSSQDDLIFEGSAAYGGVMPVSSSPSCVVRVFVPDFKEWEQTTGTSFGLRAAVQARKKSSSSFGRLFRRRSSSSKVETLYPGFFIQFNSKTDTGEEEDSAVFIIRTDDQGQDYVGPEVTPGWWTLGMSFSGDGRISYFASKGVGKLTAADRIGTHLPWGVKVMNVHTIFFNIANSNRGKWSAPWIIDDPEFFYYAQ